MEILELHALNGPSFWSHEHNEVILLKLKCEFDKEHARNLCTRAKAQFPELEFAADDVNDLVLRLAIELQNRAEMRCNFGYLKKYAGENACYIVYEYFVEKAGLYAAQASIEILSKLSGGKEPDLGNYISKLKQLRETGFIGPTSNYILNEVRARRIPIRFLDVSSLVVLGHGKRQKKIRTAVSDGTSAIGLELAGDKEDTKRYLKQSNVPVPQGIIVSSKEELVQRLHEVKFPLVIKPLDGNHGRGVTTNIHDMERALFGFDIASRVSDHVIVEEFIEGEDHRFLVIDYKLVAVSRRSPASVTGDGLHTIAQLIAEENKDPRRGASDNCVLAKIVVDDVTKKILSEKKLSLDSVLKKGEKLVLKDTANISAGGSATDLTNIVHPYNKFMVERIARMFMLDICGVDIMTNAVDIPITREVGAVIEVNAGPGIRMHSDPQNGIERNVAAPIIDMLFPNGERGVIPIIALAGSRCVTEVIELINKAARRSGLHCGCNCESGITIKGHTIKTGDCTAQTEALSVLFDPMVELAIVPCNDKDLLHVGLSFDACSTCIILDFVGTEKGFDSGEAMLKLRWALANVLTENGSLVMNADDALSDKLEFRKCCVALFSSHPDNEQIKAHIARGGIAALFEDDTLKIFRNGDARVISKFKALSADQKKILMASVLAMIVNDLKMEAILEALEKFR